MVDSKLRDIFDEYIRNFEKINQDGDIDKGLEDHREYFKWEAAYEFSQFDFEDTDDYVERLKKLNRTCDNLIDRKTSYPFNALIKCAEREGVEVVRDLFLNLFQDDGGDLDVRQRNIDEFVKDSNALAKKNGLGGYVYENTQTSAMAFLALKYPKDNCLLSTSRAKEFADRVGFVDDWGTLDHFKLDVYYRFCNEIANKALAYPPLVEKNKERFGVEFAKKHSQMKPLFQGDDKYLLVFDIIYCAALNTYGLGVVCPMDKKLEQKIREARVRQEALEDAECKLEKVVEAKKYWKKYLVSGTKVLHKKYGEGTIEKVEENETYTKIQIGFPAKEKVLQVSFQDPNLDTYLTFQVPDYQTVGRNYQMQISKENILRKHVEDAQRGIEPYKDYV